MVEIRTSGAARASIALAFAVLAAACGSSTPSSSQSSSASQPPATSTGGGGSSPTTGTPALTVSQINYQFTPAKFTVHTGATVAVKNATTGTPHTFTISGKGIDVTTNPGQTQSVVIDLPPGKYTFVCRFHQSLGMTGTLTVK